MISLTPDHILPDNKESAGIDSFMLNAHYDSANGAYGASDDCVGVVVFLFVSFEG